jgi:beta-galactosidase GanA
MGVVSVEPKHDAVLFVHANGVVTGQIGRQRMQPVPRWYAQVVELSDRIS